MHIVVLSDSYPPESTGGADQIAARLADKYQALGHTVSVITSTQDETRAARGYRDSGVFVYRLYVPHYHPRWRAWRTGAPAWP